MTLIVTQDEMTVLVETSKRIGDDYVNATMWCERYGKKWSEYRAKEKTFLRAVEKKINSTSIDPQALLGAGSNSTKAYHAEGRGKHSQTYVHPLVAIHLAQWLSPDFAVHVAEVYKRYAEGDLTLADEMAERKSPEEVRAAAVRLENIASTKERNRLLKDRGVTNFAATTNSLYKGLYDKTAAQLRSEAGLAKNDNAKKSFDRWKFLKETAANMLLEESLETRPAIKGQEPCEVACNIVGSHVKTAFKAMGK